MNWGTLNSVVPNATACDCFNEKDVSVSDTLDACGYLTVIELLNWINYGRLCAELV